MRQILSITAGLLALGLSLQCSMGLASSSGTRLRVAIIDTGLNLKDPRFADVLCPSGHIDLTGEGLRDTNGHGTHVAGIVMRNAPDHTRYCLVIVKAFGLGPHGHGTEGLAYAVSNGGASIVNFSAEGTEYSEVEKQVIASASNVSFVVAAGNEGTYYKNSYPGGYGLPNIYPVGNWDCQNKCRGPASNYGEGIIWRCGTNIKSTLPRGKEGYMSGTSMAAPMYTAELINGRTR